MKTLYIAIDDWEDENSRILLRISEEHPETEGVLEELAEEEFHCPDKAKAYFLAFAAKHPTDFPDPENAWSEAVFSGM